MKKLTLKRLDIFNPIPKDQSILNEEFDIDVEKFESITIPLCAKCGDIARPNILMFGDWKWNAKRTLNQETRYNKWKKQNKSKKL